MMGCGTGAGPNVRPREGHGRGSSRNLPAYHGREHLSVACIADATLLFKHCHSLPMGHHCLGAGSLQAKGMPSIRNKVLLQIRRQMAKEFIVDLKEVPEVNPPPPPPPPHTHTPSAVLWPHTLLGAWNYGQEC